MRQLLLTLCFLIACQGGWALPAMEIATTHIIASHDFTQQLPQELQGEATQRNSANYFFRDRANFQVIVHYDQLVRHPGFFRKVEVELPQAVQAVEINVTFGSLSNRGSKDHVLTSLPLLVQWSGKSWMGGSWSRTRQLTLFADGRLLEER